MKTKKLMRLAGALALPVALAVLALPSTEGGETRTHRAQQDLFPFLRSQPAVPQDEVTTAGSGLPAAALAVDAAVSPANTMDPTALARTEAHVRQMRTQGATDDDVYRTRAAAASPEAAAALARMEREEAIWKQRVNAYLVERERLPAGDQLQQWQQLRNAHFTREEQDLLATYEATGTPTLVRP